MSTADTTKEKFQEALEKHKQNDLLSAKKLYEEILNKDSYHVESLCNLAAILKQEKNYSTALSYLQQALKIDPKHLNALNTLANLYTEIKSFNQALKIHQKIVSLNPKNPNCYNNLAITYEKMQNYQKAFESYKQAIRCDENFIKAYNNIGVLLYKQKRYIDAVKIFELALEKSPKNIQTLCNLGAAYNKSKQYLKAEEVLQMAIALDRNNSSGAYVNLGNVYNKLNKHTLALACHKKALELNPKSATNHANLALSYKYLQRYRYAISSFKKAIEIDPEFVNAHFDLATTYLLLGNYEDGFSEYEWRFKKDEMRSFLLEHDYIFKKPKFIDGYETEDKTLLLYSEQGFGDIIQFIRFIEPFRQKYPKLKIMVQCRKELKPLLKDLDYIDEVFSKDEQLPNFDYQLSILSLAHFLNITLNTLPKKISYIRIKHDNFKLDLDAKKPNIGIVWGASNTGESYDNKVFSLKYFMPLIKSDKLKIFSLQVGDDSKEIKELNLTDDELINLEYRLSDFKKTALAIEQLDLIITSDTSVAHLAGALGKPTWVILQKQADWRWGRRVDKTPWYPTARLFRQNKQGNWSEVFEEVIKALEIKYSITLPKD